MSEDKTPIVIKRYASRKLYDPQRKVYVTLDDVARYIRDGQNVRIVDNKTDEDLTSQYLIQIIAERENKGDSPLPVSVLTDLVRLYQDQASALTPTFLTQAVEAFSRQQRTVMATITDPVKAMGAMQNWQKQQAQFLAKAFGMGGMGALGGTPARTSETSEERARPSGDARIDMLEAQLAAMQEQLKALK